MKLRDAIYWVLCLLVGVGGLSGCIEKYEADISDEDSNLLVVEGTICSGKLNQFILSHTQPLTPQGSGFSPLLVTGARVAVRGSDGSEYTAEATSGYYTCWIDSLAPDVEYCLHIETDGEVYESVPQKPLRTEEIADVRGVQNTPSSQIDVLVTPDVPYHPGQANYYSWTYDETWEVHADYTTHNMYFDIDSMKPLNNGVQFPTRGWKDATGTTIMVGASSNYDGQHIQQLKIYDIGNSDERFYYRYSGQVHQRAISKAEYEYELARRQAGSEMGGLFTPLPLALPTNLRCLTSQKRVIGFVGCSLNTTARRFFLDAKDFFVYVVPKQDARIWLDDCSEADCCLMIRQGLYLSEWLDNRWEPGGRLRTAWASRSQLDVRYKGAYIEEPAFWKDGESE